MTATSHPFILPSSARRLLSQAQWIWPDNADWDLGNCYALFRHTFALERLPKRAPLLITADQSYELYINNAYVCRGPARGFQSHWPFDEVDVAGYLRRGPNIMAVRAYHPGIGNYQYVPAGCAGLLVAGAWSGATCHSGKGWRCQRQSGIARGTVPASIQLFPQEHFDARETPQDWAALDFDDSAWPQVFYGREWNAMPWPSLEPRGIPMLREAMRQPFALLGAAQGVSAEGYDRARDVCMLRHQEGLRHSGKQRPAPASLRFPPTTKGRWRSFLIDFGKPVVGNLSLEVAGAAGGEILDSMFVETIDAVACTPHYVSLSHSKIALGSRLICRKGVTAHTFFHSYGFRYLVLTGRDIRSPLHVKASLRESRYPMQRRGEFVSSNQELNKIWEICAWTQEICSLDAFVDTPWREQAQWWGDARIQAWNTFHLDGDARLFRRGIHCIASQTTANGLTYGHAPTTAHHCILPDFTLTWILTLWDYYWQTGSLEAFLTHRPTLEAALQYFERHTDSKTGLVRYDPRYWLFLDWTPIFREGHPALLSLWLLEALDKAAALYQLAGSPKEASLLKSRARKLRLALRRLTRQDGLLRDGLTYAGKAVKDASIHTQTLALLTRLNPMHDKAMIAKSLLPFIRDENPPEVDPSAYWISYVFTALAERGHGREVAEYIQRRWAPMVEQGGTWENWNPKVGEESHSHAWSAHPLFQLMQILGGVRQTAPGWKEIAVSPDFIGDHARCTVPTPHGLIRSSWQREGTTISMHLSIPRGVRAHVCIGGMKSRVVTGASSQFTFAVG